MGALQGIPITLCILYMSIARRAGIKLHALNQPGKLVLVTPEYLTAQGCMHMLDVFDGGELRPTDLGLDTAPCPARALAARMANNLLDNVEGQGPKLEVFDLASCLKPPDVQLQRMMMLFRSFPSLAYRAAHFAEEHRDRLHPALLLVLQEAVDPMHEGRDAGDLKTYEQPPKRRPDGLRWRVGQVMRHVRYDYLCVVTSWDPSVRSRATADADTGLAIDLHRASAAAPNDTPRFSTDPRPVYGQRRVDPDHGR